LNDLENIQFKMQKITEQNERIISQNDQMMDLLANYIKATGYDLRALSKRIDLLEDVPLRAMNGAGGH